MAKNLVIVESPSKSKTIKKMLGSSYLIESSFGHIIDLPKTTMGIDIENGFKPRYKTIKGKEKVLKNLKDQAKKADNIYLASDPDREGEAIAWHISNYLKMPNKIKRITFNEITSTAVKKSIKESRSIDMNLVDAQQTRRMLDRIVGYSISPLLWGRINKNASAGRVQSVTLKLVCDLEDEINNFISEKYYEVSLITEDDIILNLSKIDNKKFDKIKDEKITKDIQKVLSDKKIEISNIEIKKKKQEPHLPFKTSTMQQLASTYLDFSPTKTMTVAQQLYEGIKIGDDFKGLITYMRTDSTRISDEASKSCQEYILEKYGKQYCGKNRIIKKGKNVQDAHEGIRPTDIYMNPEEISNYLTKDQYKLYKLIWERFLISQFAPVEYEQFKITAKKEKYEFGSTINKIIKDGYYKIYKNEKDIQTQDFPNYKENDILNIKDIKIKEDMTKPPTRYTEATLVKKLESLEIGRPSTYASILNSLKEKEYIKLVDKKIFATNIGFEVKNELEKHFKQIMNVKFTAGLENYLDQIATGKLTMNQVLEAFYNSLSKEIIEYKEEISKFKNKIILTDVMCKNNKDHMILKTGRFGKYLVCETDESEKISLKDISISDEEVENSFVSIKDKLNYTTTNKNQYTDLETELGKKYILKTGRFGYYLESEDYLNDNMRITLNKSLKDKITKGLIPIVDDLLQIKIFLEKEINSENEIIKQAGVCEKCGSKFTIKSGRYGKFLACSNYPECKNIKNIKKK